MDINIITFHKAINYGAVLQAYALYQSIKKLAPAKDDVYVYNHKNNRINEYFSLFNFGSNFRSIVKSIITMPDNAIKKVKFNNFLKRNFTFKTENTGNDCFICGSDQVWNYDLSNCDKAYFLDFVKNTRNKNSYAASFGTDSIQEQYADEVTRLLNDFNKISVREKQGQLIIKRMINRDVPVVLDPTMLLNQKEWGEIAVKNQKKEGFILLYTLTGSQSIFNFVNELSKKTGLKIICIINNITSRVHNCRYKNSAGPAEWVTLFMNASYIVTNSFHGTAFAINFNKPFFTELLPDSYLVNSRVENLLDMFSLRGRLIIDGKNNNIDETIDYIRVNKILEEEKDKSIKYLKSIIREVY